MPAIRVQKRQKAAKGTLKRLLKQLFKLYPGKLVLCALCIIFSVFSNLSASVFANFITVGITEAVNPTLELNPDRLGQHLNPFVDTYNIKAMGITITSNVTTLLIILGVIYIIAIFVSWYWNRAMAILTQDFLNKFRIKMFDHMQDLPIIYFDTHAHGDIMSLYTNDIDTIRQFVAQSLPSIFQTSLTVIFCFVSMIMNSIWMTLVVVFCTIFMILNTKIIGGKSAKYFIKQQMQVGVVEGNIEESIKGLKVIKVFSHEEKSQEKFDEINNKLGEYSTTANMHGNITGPINGNIGNIMYVLTAIMAIMILTIDGFDNLTVTGFQPDLSLSTFWGLVVSFLSMSRMFSNNVNNFSQNVIFIVMGMAGASRCFDLIDEEPEKDEGYVTLVHVKRNENGELEETEERTHDYAWKHPHHDGTLTYTELKGDIRLENVTFGYNYIKNILFNIDVYAKPGQKIAFVGATGAGKTTITNLINRFYDINDGKIRYDGINITKIKKADLRKSLGIVLQDTSLFTGTVMDNIRYGRLDATDEEIYEAAKIANAYDFITRLPEGFNTMLTGDGANLSQGQRQLISIARAAVADAPVMILDEATSSIDTRTEKLVQQGTDKLMEGRTVFVIAHRLSTVQNAKAIIVLDHGHIIERGNHETLIAQKGTYYQLYTGAFELE